MQEYVIGATAVALLINHVWSYKDYDLEDRKRHKYIIGQTGTGKSTKVKNEILKCLPKGGGLFIDLHGEDARDLLDMIPKEHKDRIIYINPGNIEKIIGFNILKHDKDPLKRELAVTQLLSIYETLWGNNIGPASADMLNMSSSAAIEQPNSTILETYKILIDDEYRESLILNNPIVKDFWEREFPQLKSAKDIIRPIKNKMRRLIGSTVLRNTLCYPYPILDISKAMEEEKWIICDFDSGRLGEDVSHLLAAIVVSNIQLNAFARPKDKRKTFFLFLDEFQNYCTKTFVTILSEARKFGLALCLSHQYTSQVPNWLLSAILGNCGTLIAFRVGFEDAKWLHEVLAPFKKNDLLNQKNFYYYKIGLKNGKKETEAKEYKKEKLPKKHYLADEIIKDSIKRYGVPKAKVEMSFKNRFNTNKGGDLIIP